MQNGQKGIKTIDIESVIKKITFTENNEKTLLRSILKTEVQSIKSFGGKFQELKGDQATGEIYH